MRENKVYILLQNIQHPGGISKAGTESIYERGYYIFKYNGGERTKQNGWLGSGYHCDEDFIDTKPDWFELKK